MKPIIKVENLSKQYRLGANQAPQMSFRETLVAAARSPIEKLKKREERKEHKSFWALKDVDFEIYPGEVVGIIGRNGAGKSTLLKILSRITEPTKGRIELYGRVGSLLEVGTGFHPELTGRENIFLNGAILGMRQSEIARKFDEIVDFAEVEKFIDTPVKYYSSGMYTRLAFAVAANLEPEILIVDEVLAVGDAEFQKKCLGKMKDVSEHGRTVLFVSHNMTAVQSLCEKAILMKNGNLVKSGKTQEIVDIYSSKEFVGKSVREWQTSDADAPGNDQVKFRRIAIVPQANVEEINVETPLHIEFEFESFLDANVQLNLSIVLWTLGGECIFNVVSSIVSASQGVYKAVCSIPGNFLNDGKYSLEIYVIKDTSAIVFRQEDIVSFEVLDNERTGNWYGKWIGAVRPKFPFNLDKVVSNE